MVFNVNLSLGAKLARLFVKICGIATHMVVKYLVKYTLAILNVSENIYIIHKLILHISIFRLNLFSIYLRKRLDSVKM